MEALEFAGKLAVVTGAAGGIGAAVVRALSVQGARVVAFDRDRAAVETLAARLGLEHGRVRGHALDVRRSEAVEDAIAAVEAEVGAIDIAVNVAGVLKTGTVLETSDDAWTFHVDVNATGVFNLSRSVARRMAARRRGAIVTVSSNAARVPRHGMAAYAASKAAASMFTRCLGLELAGSGVRCNVVAPGSTRTAMQEGLWTDGRGEERVIAGVPELYKMGIPLKRIAEPEDIADAVLFLASERARHITMAELIVDGGAT